MNLSEPLGSVHFAIIGNEGEKKKKIKLVDQLYLFRNLE